MGTVTETNLGLKLLRKGKVRDTYELDDSLLMVATDRLSAFDVVFSEGIPKKGQVLTAVSVFWFKKTESIVPNHYLGSDMPPGLPDYLKGRAIIVKKAIPVMMECVVRGYITGSAWKEYREKGTVCGIKLPSGLKNGSELPEPIFTPSTKAELGHHDENVDEATGRQIVGAETFDFVKTKSIELYNFAKKHAMEKGLVLADTKFEFGILEKNGKKQIILIDEALTPDSSRYWIKEKYEHGILESLDKQYVRDYLEKTGWNKAPPPPKLPQEIIEKTTERYLQAYKILTGKDI
ncbi:phosphoribosylaminoimidazolesuccinocarboxamide synthase [Candidatus Micrarchaeota archaeon]|nr:phosphoribosylaminoimidazolesuccinocarboxamide synthase [Candidatus Micrarchaeota archaeon]